jgi:predicted dithiol-disulfide oxidoreductase (DUF899 family)
MSDLSKPNIVTRRVVSRAEWLEERRRLLEKEKAFTRDRDRLNAERRALPWVAVEKEYVFDGPSGKVTLADLFGKADQLFIKHFMLPPGQARPCIGCSFEVDHVQGILEHLEHHGVAYVAVARAPIAEIEAVRRRMGWRFPFVSSFSSDFNYDYHVSFTPEELVEKRAFYNFRHSDPGLPDQSGNSVFFKDERGQIFHTYSSFSRGGEEFLGTYAFLDRMPKGRDENGPSYTLGDWVRLRDEYGKGGPIERTDGPREVGCDCADE